ncbi:peptidase M16 [Haloferula helveola]|uniref:Peptidase M16 n=1 Tax=Haloferula helveola TaxID=490095 RepID=A0ABM7R9U4_9BACT|nr:peptidase M16 [Haloferula helveola]
MNLRRENPCRFKANPTGAQAVLRMLGVSLVLLFARAEGADPAAPGGGIDLPTHRAELANGLVVVLAPDPAVPLVAVRLFYKVGSRNEHEGITGVAHLFEHMMFNGTEHYGPGMFDRVLEEAGGGGNAFTSTDLTCYTTTVPKNSLETILRLEADRMTGLQLQEKILNNEREVVLEEMRQSQEDSAVESARVVFMASLFQAHPYRWPVLGWRSDVEGIDADACRDFYRTYYAPNNAVLALSGDLDVDATLKLIEDKFGKIPRGPKVPGVRTAEPEREFTSRSTVTRRAPNPVLFVGFQGPAAKDEDHAVLDLADEILAAGPTARLYRRLVLEEKLATDVGLYLGLTVDPGPMYFEVSLHPGGDPKPVEAIISEELERLAKEPVPAEELERAITSRTADLVRQSLESPLARAEAIGESEVLAGDHRRVMKLPAIWRKVDPVRLQQVAAKYFRPEVAVVTVLSPTPEDGEAEEGEEGSR